MFTLVVASAIHLAAVQNAAATAARSAFADCVRNAAVQAKGNNVAIDGLTPLMRQACEAQGTKLKSVLVAFDVKNGISRKQAAADAELQLEDFYATQEDKYRYELEKKSKSASASSN